LEFFHVSFNSPKRKVTFLFPELHFRRVIQLDKIKHDVIKAFVGTKRLEGDRMTKAKRLFVNCCFHMINEHKKPFELATAGTIAASDVKIN